MIRRVVIAASAALLSACSLLPSQPVEVLYTYRPVGACAGGYVGESHTPNRRISYCTNLLVSRLHLRVDAPEQRVTVYEEDLKFNKEPELLAFAPAAVSGCHVIDRNRFACNGISRLNGTVELGEAYGGRRVSSSWTGYLVARLEDGWIKDNSLALVEWIGI